MNPAPWALNDPPVIPPTTIKSLGLVVVTLIVEVVLSPFAEDITSIGLTDAIPEYSSILRSGKVVAADITTVTVLAPAPAAAMLSL
jgi:hypothetical protein